MCGIFSLYEDRGSKDSLMEEYSKMSALLAHRGSDMIGVCFIPPTGRKINKPIKRKKKDGSERFLKLEAQSFKETKGFMGHHRLSIIDLNELSAQPFIDESQCIALSCNGEIYNYIELRSELKRKGHTFVTDSDTEVALKAYLEWGVDCFSRFNGDFAILFYDHKKRSFVGARDRFGVKPLFYTISGRKIAFSSELKGFLGLRWFNAVLDERVAYHYLVADFPTPETLKGSFLKDVYSVPSGHWFILSLDSFKIQFHRYWDLKESDNPLGDEKDLKDSCAKFDYLLKDSVNKRLRCDVKLGAFLSGGMDSSSITWHMVNLGQRFPTFSSILPNTEVDESGNIDEITEKLGVRNYKQEVNYDDFINEIEELIFFQDEPFTTLNVYLQYKNIQIAKVRGVKVLFDGSGADEYLAGYKDYELLADADNFSNNDKDTAFNLCERLSRFIEFSNKELDQWHQEQERGQRMLKYISSESRLKYRGNENCVDRPLDSNYKGLFRSSYLKYALKHSVQDGWMNKSLPWDNRYLDRNGMRCGIEVRVPFQDHRLVELIFSLPPNLIYHKGFSKYILRKTMKKRLPKRIVSSKKKIGFEFPFCHRIRNNDKFRNFFYDLMNQEDFSRIPLVNIPELKKEFKKIVDGQSFNYNLWRVFNLYLWIRGFIKKDRVSLL